MKRLAVFLLCACFLAGLCRVLPAADDGKTMTDKSVSQSLANTAHEVKTETVKVYQESKDAIVKDVKSLKEDIPKGLKEAKESAIQQSKDIKDSATKEFKEIKHNLSNPQLTPKAESK